MYVTQHQVKILGQPPCNVLEHECDLKLNVDRVGCSPVQLCLNN